MTTHTLIATATFGLESVVQRELIQLGYQDAQIDHNRVRFSGTVQDIARCNLWLRSADRLLLEVGEFPARTFDELYDAIRRLRWQDYIDASGKLLIDANSVKSKLFSLRDIQKIAHKAVADKLMFIHKTNWLKEDGARYRIKVGILKDQVSVTLDTSGEGLHKRGYRVETVEAPMKETLAAAIVQLSYWTKDRPLYDVFCGSGTMPIEAAMIGRNIAPGLARDFDSKHWHHLIPEAIWKDEARAAYQAIDYDVTLTIHASDLSEENLNAAKENAIEAGVDDAIHFEHADFRDVSYDDPYGVLISNPPYGERLMDEADVIALTRDMRQVFAPLSTWSIYLLTSLSSFEQTYGTHADKRRKLYNGRIETWLYQYHGPRPPQDM
jgi:putative N6-adenine-specific DNA methylase